MRDCGSLDTGSIPVGSTISVFMNLQTPVKEIPYIGEFYQKKLGKLGIKTVHDFLYHLPNKYEDLSKITSISRVKEGDVCTVRGKVVKIENTKIFKKKIALTEAIIEDGTSKINAVWINQSYLLKNIPEGEEFFFSGKVTIKGNKIFLSNPSFEKFDPGKENIHTGRIIPIYPETRGITSKWMRFVMKNLLNKNRGTIPEILPDEIIKEFKLLGAEEALYQAHFPESKKKVHEAKRRISFEQIFLIQVSILMEKIKMSQEKAISIPANIDVIKKMTSSLSFKLTDAQRKSAWQIIKDMERNYPMNRLLEGDVGSGKTIVAAIGILNAVKGRTQVALMAPTEVLAKQHFHGIFKVLNKFNLNIGLLTGKEDKFYSKKLKNDTIEVSRSKLLKKVKEGEIDLLIGTHALIQGTVKFKNLSLVILDEQHRFGVKQRSELVARKAGQEVRIPHLLSMTATPIPRTLTLSIYSDLDLSIIDEMPKGRKKIITKIVSPNERVETYEFIRKELNKGYQVFIICPRIDPSEDENSKWSKVKAVKEEYEMISQKIFPEFKIGLMHGKMTVKEKEKTMKDFRNKKTDILVSTSVIEVGIDVPNAGVMIIEGAERFGLAQLHQFRGRVGRGDSQSYCFLFPESFAEKTRNRLKALLSCEDGFALAEKDLELRGPGDFMGNKQWGVPDIVMTSLTNLSLVQETKNAARMILEKDLQLRKYPVLKSKVQLFREKIHLE